MKNIKYSLSLLFTIVLIITSCAEQEEAPTKPNILFIFADDLTFQSINALGASDLITPNLDKLVKSGMSFSNSFNMGGWNGAVCVASRTMLLTGKYIWNAYQADSLMGKKNYQTPVWSELMETAGYDTYMSGKWHIKKPATAVFQNVVHVRPGMPNQTESGYNRPLYKNDSSWLPWDKSKEGFWKGGKHWSEVLADVAVAFLDSASKKEAPFFMYLAFNAPHDPRQSPKAFVEMYPVDDVDVPSNFLTEYPFNEEMGSGRKLRDERLAPFPRTEYSVKVNRQEYYASITHMDEQIGKILDGLEASGKMDNTYIIFAADHGLSVGQHGLLGKQNMYDHSMRVPLIISGRNISQNKAVETDVYVQDIMPTVLELAGINKPAFVDFYSILPFTKGQGTGNYPSIYGAYTMKQRMIRSDGFKLIAYPRAKKIRLFNLNDDPLEMNDLSDNTDFKAEKDKLWAALLLLQKEMNDPLNLEEYISN